MDAVMRDKRTGNHKTVLPLSECAFETTSRALSSLLEPPFSRKDAFSRCLRTAFRTHRQRILWRVHHASPIPFSLQLIFEIFRIFTQHIRPLK
jgi:hypothetical protein